jgi:hypothetical protein
MTLRGRPGPFYPGLPFVPALGPIPSPSTPPSNLSCVGYICGGDCVWLCTPGWPRVVFSWLFTPEFQKVPLFCIPSLTLGPAGECDDFVLI